MSKIWIRKTMDAIYDTCVEATKGENLYQVLTYNHIWNLLPCRGIGICGKCMVYIHEEGMECKACKYEIQDEELHITLGVTNQTYVLMTDFSLEQEEKITTKHPMGLAIDIGTTTIGSCLVDLETKEVLMQQGIPNHQSQYGEDVIARIQYAITSEIGKNTIRETILKDLQDLYQYYLSKGLADEQLKKVSITGNPTMLHILQGLDLHGMAGYPFTPATLKGELIKLQNMEVYILPGKSAFVGADIVCGMEYLGLGNQPEYDLFMDLGTNGELWLLSHHGGSCTSTACGSAFAHLLQKGKGQGTTILKEIAKAYQESKINSTGLLADAYFENGIPSKHMVITQETIRQFQLAKAAITTGIELLAYNEHLPLDEIHQVYIAGGFGYFLDLEAAFILGMLPEELKGKIKFVGNTALKGAVDALFHLQQYLTLKPALEQSKVLDLSMNKNFQEFFIHRLNFPPVFQK